MTNAPTTSVDAAPEPWLRGRPRSWPFFALGSAFVAPLQWAPLLLFHRPGTGRGWLVWFLGVWALTAASFLFRDPVFNNPYARRLRARTDPGASSARVTYLFLVFVVPVLILVLLLGAFSLLVPLVRPS
jgi:hypothetical protein